MSHTESDSENTISTLPNSHSTNSILASDQSIGHAESHISSHQSSHSHDSNHYQNDNNFNRKLSNNNSIKKINDLSINLVELRNYNCNYIFSKYPIEEHVIILI